MIEMLADRIRDPGFQDIYIAVGVAILILPMVALTWWYHSHVNRTDGGRRLMREQRYHNSGARTLSGAARNLRGAAGMSRDIASGRYGEDVRRLQNRTYAVVLAWIVANTIVFGALIWAQDYNQRRDAAAGTAAGAVRR